MQNHRSLAALVALVAFAACTTTTQEKVKMAPEMQGFMGDAYPLLTPGKEGQADLRYIAQDVDWKQYNGTVLEPVQFWAGSDSKVSPEAQQMLATYFYNSLKANLGKVGVNLVDLPGPGVMRAQIAFTDVTKATPVLRTVSVIVPQARVINQAQQLVTGSYGFSGSAEVAIKVTDSQDRSAPGRRDRSPRRRRLDRAGGRRGSGATCRPRSTSGPSASPTGWSSSARRRRAK